MLAAWGARADCVAIDAPAHLSTELHAGDLTLSPKFQRARCAEIALGQAHGYWVPWVTPTELPADPSWIRTGLQLYAALTRAGARSLIEVFPYAGFRHLTKPAHLAKKSSAAGLKQRAAALYAAGVRGDYLEMWSHDSLDATLAALVALHHMEGTAEAVSCGHDASAIWLPGPTACA